MEQSPSWEANRFSASQEIPHILLNPIVHYRIHKCPPPAPILRQLDQSPRLFLQMICNMTRFYGEELLAPRPNLKPEDHSFSAVRDCLFNVYLPY
jgi:hypothetical protein